MNADDYLVFLETADNGYLAILKKGRDVVGKHCFPKELTKEELGKWVEEQKNTTGSQ